MLQLATSEAQGHIVASGSVCLLNNEGKALWLHNVQCVPHASTNLVSVSSAIRDGAMFVTRENGSYSHLTAPNGWECSITEQFGLYVLKGIYPTSLPVVCQTCMSGPFVGRATTAEKHNCKLRKLWHDRLGHPGKTASERLSREQLCTGIPVSLIPCEVCEQHCDPCIRGKLV